jgi:hypothetical protein
MRTLAVMTQMVRDFFSSEEKWRKGTFGWDFPNQCCIVGSFRNLGFTDEERDVLIPYLRSFLPDNYRGLIGFNDHPEVTWEVFSAFLDRAVTAARHEA